LTGKGLCQFFRQRADDIALKNMLTLDNNMRHAELPTTTAKVQ
jgi:hypothetical protein